MDGGLAHRRPQPLTTPRQKEGHRSPIFGVIAEGIGQNLLLEPHTRDLHAADRRHQEGGFDRSELKKDAPEGYDFEEIQRMPHPSTSCLRIILSSASPIWLGLVPHLAAIELLELRRSARSCYPQHAIEPPAHGMWPGRQPPPRGDK